MPNKRLGTAELPFLSISKQILLSRKYRFSQISSIKDLSFICNSNKSKARVSPWITPPSACPYSFLPPDAAYHHTPFLPENTFCFSYIRQGQKSIRRNKEQNLRWIPTEMPSTWVWGDSDRAGLSTKNVSSYTRHSDLAKALYGAQGGWQELDCKSKYHSLPELYIYTHTSPFVKQQ